MLRPCSKAYLFPSVKHSGSCKLAWPLSYRYMTWHWDVSSIKAVRGLSWKARVGAFLICVARDVAPHAFNTIAPCNDVQIPQSATSSLKAHDVTIDGEFLGT
jgi:hypothetical protein